MTTKNHLNFALDKVRASAANETAEQIAAMLPRAWCAMATGDKAGSLDE